MISDPIGIFRARSTKDGEAFERDGQSYFAINPLQERAKPAGDRDLFEIQFGDGIWMLARLDDLVRVVPKTDEAGR
ncbi:hypothetical protein [Nocardioides allogilvus]|uniref:hypothetical protein n=1 Tax=Nocardioides allogilvus TaxID=2072017 RepID=UPI000D3077C4|nr:hypothetical protein [Nocardioides allogilvus]